MFYRGPSFWLGDAMTYSADNPGAAGGMVKLSELQARAREAADSKARDPLNRMQELQVEAREQCIIVTLPGTRFRGVYQKQDGRQLLPRLGSYHRQQGTVFTRLQFLARARKLANDKARELGWID
jgi:hypothetical protein